MAWECFPRHLSRSEYANPYGVFEKCVAQPDLAGWRILLRDLFAAAAWEVTITEAVVENEMEELIGIFEYT